MSMAIDYMQKMCEKARLIVLKELALQRNESLATGMLDSAMEVAAIYQDLPWVHLQIDYLQNMGAVTVINAGDERIVTLTKAGRRHLNSQVFIDGVQRNEPGK